ncbi:MAG: hypothetical protein Q9165_006381 [Trypethelium subeluteriae]
MAHSEEPSGFTDITNQERARDTHTPTLLSPPESKTPPTAKGKRHLSDNTANANGRGSEAVDPGALSKALRQFEDAGKRRERTPTASPSRKRQRVYGDRFIPNRAGQDLQASFSLMHEDGSPATPSKSTRRTPNHELHFQRTEEANRTFSNVLRSEMFDSTVPQAVPQNLSPNDHDNSSNGLPAPNLTPSTPHKNLFTFSASRNQSLSGHWTPSRTPHSRHGPNLDARSELYSLSPVKLNSQQMLLSPRKSPRAVPKVPYKVLDAPDLADDFYLNLVDWGSQNILAVGLGACVYMWNSESGRVTKLLDLEGDDNVTSVNWIQRGSHLAVGTSRGFVQIWDVGHSRRLRTMTGHTARVGALAWNEHILTSGSRDRIIYHRDVRSPEQWTKKLVGHKQEVCGLKWNSEDRQLASGGNDNKLFVWDNMETEPLHKWSEHGAAVKAIAWSPHQRGLLASGGGTADRRICFWNTIAPATSSAAAAAATYSSSSTFPSTFLSSSNDYSLNTSSTPPNPYLLRTLDTGSQVCNLAWSKNSNELVSTHGYSQNQIVVWKYPSMQQVACLTGHTYRVLYLAMRPDGKVIVTGAGDETLRFWDAFKRKESKDDASGSSGVGGLGREGVIR